MITKNQLCILLFIIINSIHRERLNGENTLKTKTNSDCGCSHIFIV